VEETNNSVMTDRQALIEKALEEQPCETGNLQQLKSEEIKHHAHVKEPINRIEEEAVVAFVEKPTKARRSKKAK